MQEINVAFVGNPNCGKTTLFNAYTGARLKVANWPGVTVEKKEGAFKYHNNHYKLVDLPGIYALTGYTMEEKISRSYILSDDVDVIINVVDASALERSLYLTLQLSELGKPVVVALNMMDIVEQRGMELDLHRLSEMLGMPVIPVSGRKRTGLDSLIHAVAHHKDKPTHKPTEHNHSGGNRAHLHEQYTCVYDDATEDRIEGLCEALEADYPALENTRWYAIKLLEHDDEISEAYPVAVDFLKEKGCETDIIRQKYDLVEEIMEEVLLGKAKRSAATDKADRLLTHPIWGFPVFLLIMAFVFFLTFTVGDFLSGYFELALEALSGGVRSMLTSAKVAPWLISLTVDGILTGVGGILTFLPNIAILFLALAFLEDSGYMARVAYVADGLMSRLGLSGRAFLPMLLGFGCTVPAVMATRALEDPSDKKRTILAVPFMSCSARLPVYVLLSEVFFGRYAMLAAYSMYLIGLLVAVLSELVISKFIKGSDERALLIELPEYKSPAPRTVAIYVWEKVCDYLTKAGTVIFLASVVLWFLQSFNFGGLCELTDSFAASIGKALVPLFKPCGLGYWQIVVSLIAGIAGKEVVVSSLSVLYGIGNISAPAGMAALSSVLGSAGFTAVNAYAMMLFVLLYVPCIAAVATIRRETGSVKWTIASLALQLGSAWIVSTLFYQIATLLV